MQDMLTAAIQYANDLVDTGSVSFVSIATEQENVNETIVATELDFEGCLSDFEATSFPRSWARRADYGKIYGAKYIDDYKEDLFEMFTAGEEDKAHKKGPGKMLDCLKQRYPGVLKLPSEIEIRQYVGSLVAKAKKTPGVKLTFQTRGIRQRFKKVIEKIVKESEYEIKPSVALNVFKTRCPRDEDSMGVYPTDAQVRSLVSSIKGKRKFCETRYLVSSDDADGEEELPASHDGTSDADGTPVIVQEPLAMSAQAH